MDIEDPKHLERFRDQVEVKAVLMQFQPNSDSRAVRFERSSKNKLYWPLIENVASRFFNSGHTEEICETHCVYGKQFWLLGISTNPTFEYPFTIAILASDGASKEILQAFLRRVSHDYWYGSYFFK